MLRLLKHWLKDRLFTEDEQAFEGGAAQVVHRGKTEEERLGSWQQLATMFDSPPGLLYQALMQKEALRIQQLLLYEEDSKKRDVMLQRMRQMAWVLSYPDTVKVKIRELQGKIRTREETPSSRR